MIAFDTAPTGPTGDVSPGLLGFLVVAGLGFALYMLVKSMRKQISRIEVPSEAELRQRRNDAGADGSTGPAEPPASTASTGSTASTAPQVPPGPSAPPAPTTAP
ncbi:hypothetical protein [Streptosporangium longisporum]|uniref:Signal recognition particle-docking protein FtsY n=1 Tax=Streptosporangium longisporum TaxID=46187 RepID=A0ABP6L3Q1_9ACTN